MGELTEAITIDADPGTIWSVLVDTDAYREWNPLIRYEGALRERARPRVRLRLPGLPAVYTRPRIVAVVPERELRWKTRVPGVSATHTFRLERLENGTRFVQSERFDGVLADAVLDRFARASSRGFEQMNRGLKRRAERLVRER